MPCSPSTATCRASSSARCRWLASRSAPSSATRLGPLLLPGGSHSQYAPLFGLIGALLVGGAVRQRASRGSAFARARRCGSRGCARSTACSARLLTACVGLGIAWIVGAVALHSIRLAAAAPRHPAVGDPRELNQLLPPSGPILNALARLRPAALGHRARGRRAAADQGDPRRTGGVRAAPATASCGCSGPRAASGIEGSGWVAAPRHWSSPTPTSSRARTTPRSQIGGRPPALPAHAIAFDPARRHRPPAGPRPVAAPAVARARPTAPGPPAAILGYPLDGPFTGRAGPDRPDPDGQHPGRLRPGPRAAQHHLAPRARAPRQLRRPDGRRRRQVVATVFAAITGHGGARAGSRCPTPSCGRS